MYHFAHGLLDLLVLLDCVLEVLQVRHYSMMLFLLRVVIGCLLVAVHFLELNIILDKKLTHFKMATAGGPEQTILPIFIDVVDIGSVLHQNFCAFDMVIRDCEEEGSLSVLVVGVQVVLVAFYQVLEKFVLACVTVNIPCLQM